MPEVPTEEHRARKPDELVARDGPFGWELAGNCAYASRFAYSSDGSRHA